MLEGFKQIHVQTSDLEVTESGDQSARDSAGLSPCAGSRCELARRVRIMRSYVHAGFLPLLRKPRSELTSTANIAVCCR